nr:DUF4870 domain-containing protein [Anaerolineae bacterium]
MEFEGVSTEATQDERILAALAHASVLLPFWGLIGAIVIWITQREKSRFVGFQALQGMAYQLVLVLGGFLGFACYMCSFLGTFLLMPVGFLAADSTAEPDAIGGLVAMLATSFPFCIMGLFILVGFAFVLYGLYGAVRVLQGHDFRYVLIGSWLERYLSSNGEPAAAG